MTPARFPHVLAPGTSPTRRLALTLVLTLTLALGDLPSSLTDLYHLELLSIKGSIITDCRGVIKQIKAIRDTQNGDTASNTTSNNSSSNINRNNKPSVSGKTGNGQNGNGHSGGGGGGGAGGAGGDDIDSDDDEGGEGGGLGPVETECNGRISQFNRNRRRSNQFSKGRVPPFKAVTWGTGIRAEEFVSRFK